MATQRRSSVLSFQLEGVEGPGAEIGRGSYAVVEEYDFQGLSSVGKSIHHELYDNASPRERETMLERFEGECEMLSRLHHPHIVQFLGVHFNEGSPLPVLLMERLHSTLAACVDRHGKLPDECCYSVLRDVGVGLRYLHGHTPNPIVHRDLTANNVLLTPDMSAKISDLGVAKILNLHPSRMTQLTKCPGTPSYMPPEALIARPIYSTKMDIFAYGNLMTHVFCGQWPIPAEIFRANPSNPHDMTALTEVQRREEYLNDIGDAHPLMGLMRECLSNNPILRPNIPEALHRVNEVMPQFPPSFENKVEYLQRIQADATEKASLNAQVEQMEGQLRVLTNENVTLNVQVRDKEGELRKLSDEKADQFTNLSTQIEQKEGQLRSLSAQLEQLQKTTVEETETLNATHGLEAERLSVRLDELRAEAEGLRAAVRAKEERLSAREEEIKATQEIVKAREQELALKDLTVAAKEQVIEANNRLLNAKDRDISSLRMEVASRDATLRAKDSAIASLRSPGTYVETKIMAEAGDAAAEHPLHYYTGTTEDFQTLEGECPICMENIPTHDMVTMPGCTDKFCKECFKVHFTIIIKEKMAKHFNCPLCGEPDLRDMDHDAYLELFVIMIRQHLDEEYYDICLQKLRDYYLSKEENFCWCANEACWSGFICDGDPNVKKIQCPDCSKFMCFQCKKLWEEQHQGLSCDQFAQWKQDNDPDVQEQGRAAYLRANGIQCPDCHMCYDLARGGSMHFKCTQCPNEFCSGCGQSYRKGQQCGKLQSCVAKGLHAHHPRDCLFYLRDFDVVELQAFLQENNIMFDTDPPQAQVEAAWQEEGKVELKCHVPLQKEGMDGLVDEECGRDVLDGHAGVCEKHYKEYLVDKINQAKLDPVTMYETEKVKVILLREEKEVPDQDDDESDDDFREVLIKHVKQQLLLTRKGCSIW